MELPRRPNGDVDWKTLGNILTARILGEVVCASYVDPRFRRKESSSIIPDTKWRYSHEENDVVVLTPEAASKSSCCCVMGRGVVSVPLKRLSHFIMNPESTYAWDRMLNDIKHMEVLSESETHKDTITCMKLKNSAVCCLLKTSREFLYYLHSQFVDGKFVQTALSLECSKFPPTCGVQRGRILPASGWVLEPFQGSATKTLVSYIIDVDLMGAPLSARKKVIKRHPLFIHYIRIHLLGQQEGKAPSSSSSSSSPSRPANISPLSSSSKKKLLSEAAESIATSSTASTMMYGATGGGGVGSSCSVSVRMASQSGCHYEDPMPLGMFMANGGVGSGNNHRANNYSKQALCNSSSNSNYCNYSSTNNNNNSSSSSCCFQDDSFGEHPGHSGSRSGPGYAAHAGPPPGPSNLAAVPPPSHNNNNNNNNNSSSNSNSNSPGPSASISSIPCPKQQQQQQQQQQFCCVGVGGGGGGGVGSLLPSCSSGASRDSFFHIDRSISDSPTTLVIGQQAQVVEGK